MATCDAVAFVAIVAHTAAAHGGTVKAANEPDAGAKFVLKLPGADELAEPVAL